MIRELVWSGKLPEAIEHTPLGYDIIDASVKRRMLLRYGLRPWEMDRMSVKMFDVWTRIDREEEEKDRVTSNKV